jgi:hypothetical protein
MADSDHDHRDDQDDHDECHEHEHEEELGCVEQRFECDCEEEHETKCDRDRKNNIWIDGGNPATGIGGACQLDTMTKSQIINSIQRDPRARADLLRVTSCRHLRKLAVELPDLPSVPEGDALQKEMNSNADTIPFYHLFRGNPPYAQ